MINLKAGVYMKVMG